MALTNYFVGMKRGDNNNPYNITATTATVGTAADVELRIQIDNGSNATGITRKDVNLIANTLLQFINAGGLNEAGANLPPM